MGFNPILADYKANTDSVYETRVLDFANPNTFETALTGIDSLFLMPPPHLSDVPKYFHPFLDVCKRIGIKHIVLLSLQGAEHNSIVPHRKIELYIEKLNIPYTFVRPCFFMQNLSTTHLKEIREHDEIYVPAGHGRTSFIDVRDIGAVIAKCLADGESHFNKSYEITGKDAVTYGEVATMLSEEISRRITYKNPNPFAFIIRKKKEGWKLGFIIVMLAIYTIAKFGKADVVTNQFSELMKRGPIRLSSFIKDNRDLWLR